jgi:hypothetical protein
LRGLGECSGPFVSITFFKEAWDDPEDFDSDRSASRRCVSEQPLNVNAQALAEILSKHSDDIPINVYRNLVLDIATTVTHNECDNSAFALACGIVK